MKIYHYDSSTGELTGESTARQSPLEPGVYLIPANATSVPPPTTNTGDVAVFRGGSWLRLADNRGVWFDSSGEVIEISEIGETADGLTKNPPNPTLEEIKAAAHTDNKNACRSHILAHYDEETQRNAALGIYGAEYTATCADFISRCIMCEDAAFDAVAACTTVEELSALPAIVFPEV